MLNGVRCPALHTAGRDSPSGGCWGDRKSQGRSLPSQSNGGVRRHDNLRDFPGWERPSPDRGGNSGFLLMLSLPRGLPPSPSRGAEWGTVPPTCQGPPAQLCTWSARTHPHIPREPAHLLSLCPGWGVGVGTGTPPPACGSLSSSLWSGSVPPRVARAACCLVQTPPMEALPSTLDPGRQGSSAQGQGSISRAAQEKLLCFPALRTWRTAGARECSVDLWVANQQNEVSRRPKALCCHL